MTRRSEDAVIAHYFAPLAGLGGLGLRDDAALATPRPGYDLVVTKDMLVAGGHFFPDDPPGAIARKALRVNLSDLAAKGATPLGFLLGLGLPADWTEDWLAGFVAGLADDARTFACPLLGGDTIAMPATLRKAGPLTLSITALGEVPAGRMVPRTGASAGDELYVTGTIGDAALGLQVRRDEQADAGWLAALDAASAQALLGRHHRPEPRLALTPALLAHARAAMDVSDGFVGDLTKMLKLEGLTASVAVADMPLSDAVRAAIALEPGLLATALTGGDDYELLCAVASDNAAAFAAAAAAAGIVVSRVGRAVAGSQPVTVLGRSGLPLTIARGSFQHFT